MVTHLAPSVVNTLTRPDPARVYRTCTKRISLESSLKELSFKTITKSMGVSMKELWTEMCVLKKWYQRPLMLPFFNTCKSLGICFQLFPTFSTHSLGVSLSHGTPTPTHLHPLSESTPTPTHLHPLIRAHQLPLIYTLSVTGVWIQWNGNS